MSEKNKLQILEDDPDSRKTLVNEYNELIKTYSLIEIDYDKEYTEVHHIIPKCLGGDDNEENLIRLPYEYHVRAHILLAEIYSDHDGLWTAVNAMLGNPQENKISNRASSITNMSVLEFKDTAQLKMIDRHSENIKRAKNIIESEDWEVVRNDLKFYYWVYDYSGNKSHKRIIPEAKIIWDHIKHESMINSRKNNKKLIEEVVSTQNWDLVRKNRPLYDYVLLHRTGNRKKASIDPNCDIIWEKINYGKNYNWEIFGQELIDKKADFNKVRRENKKFYYWVRKYRNENKIAQEIWNLMTHLS